MDQAKALEMTSLQTQVYCLSGTDQVLLVGLIEAVTDNYTEEGGPWRARIRYLSLQAAYGEELLALAMQCREAGVRQFQLEAKLQQDAAAGRASIIVPGQGGN